MSDRNPVDPLAIAIAHHLRSSAELMAACRQLADFQSTNNAEVIARLDKIIARLDTLAAPGAPNATSLPAHYDAWDIEHIARYMKRTADTVRREIVVHPTFPRPMRIPGASRARALYKAREVIAWLESHSR